MLSAQSTLIEVCLLFCSSIKALLSAQLTMVALISLQNHLPDTPGPPLLGDMNDINMLLLLLVLLLMMMMTKMVDMRWKSVRLNGSPVAATTMDRNAKAGYRGCF